MTLVVIVHFLLMIITRKGVDRFFIIRIYLLYITTNVLEACQMWEISETPRDPWTCIVKLSRNAPGRCFQLHKKTDYGL